MQIETKFLGAVEVEETEIITFAEGLPGFSDLQKFALLALDADLPLALLQSTEEVEVGFIVAYPFAFKQNYAFDLSEDDKQALQIEKEEDVLTYSIVTLKESFNDSTLNLLAPLIINMDKKLGRQIVLENCDRYDLRYPIKAFTEGSTVSIETKFLGTVEVREQDILTFSEGLPGFLELKKFALLALDADLPLALLQSIEDKEVGFVVAYPFAFKQDYAFDLSDEDKEALQLEREEDVLTYTIVTLKESFNESTLNLLAPLVINKAKNIGKQIVLHNARQYDLRHPIS